MSTHVEVHSGSNYFIQPKTYIYETYIYETSNSGGNIVNLLSELGQKKNRKYM